MRNQILLVLLLTALFSSIGLAEITTSVACIPTTTETAVTPWGDFERHGARIAIVNASGILGDDRIRMTDENTIDYHCWPENAAIMAETLMKKAILVLTGADCSGPAVEIARVGAKYEIPVISNGANASMLSSVEEFPYFVRVVTPSEQYEGGCTSGL